MRKFVDVLSACLLLIGMFGLGGMIVAAVSSSFDRDWPIYLAFGAMTGTGYWLRR